MILIWRDNTSAKDTRMEVPQALRILGVELGYYGEGEVTSQSPSHNICSRLCGPKCVFWCIMGLFECCIASVILHPNFEYVCPVWNSNPMSSAAAS